MSSQHLAIVGIDSSNEVPFLSEPWLRVKKRSISIISLSQVILDLNRAIVRGREESTRVCFSREFRSQTSPGERALLSWPFQAGATILEPSPTAA
jgi:hypothetical protein